VGRLYSRAELLEQRARWKSQRQRVVFTNGCYDIVHPGHIRLIEYARSCGDVLIVALNTDAGVRRLKGPCRPLNAEQERAGRMAALDALQNCCRTFLLRAPIGRISSPGVKKWKPPAAQ
jgi:rfaE bifunctional protein nucleotidyltransferase chain/domain